MDTKRQTRSSINKVVSGNTLTEGVGARQIDAIPLQWGGGYLDICTDSKFSEKKSRDPRLEELKDMGLGGFWRELACEVGYDAFIVMWVRLSDRACRADSGHRVYVPTHDTFIRYQRNRYIRSLDAAGLTAKEIQTRVCNDLSEKISHAHIQRLRVANR